MLCVSGLGAACGPQGDWAPGARALQTGAATLCDPENSDLRLTELLPNPLGPDAGREWLELFNAGDAPLCLDRAELRIGRPGRERHHVVRGVGCMPPKAVWLWGDGAQGQMLAPAPEAPSNPGEANVRYRYGGLAMPNDVGRVAIVCQQAVLADVHYGGPAEAPAPAPGRALARVPMDGPGVWCLVRGPTDGAGNMGTPGAINPGCDTCIDDGDGAVRPRRPPEAGDLTLGWVLADPKGADANREWVEIAAGSEAVDLLGLGLEAQSPGRGVRTWRLKAPGCGTLQPGTTWRLPILSPRAAATYDGPLWRGTATLPNGPLQLLVRDDARPILCAQVPASRANNPVQALKPQLCSPSP